jgi:predicted transcriptional regulator
MTRSERRLLEDLCDLCDRTDAAVTTDRLCDYCGVSEGTARTALDSLESYELVAQEADDRWRPTVTGRELLELDIDDDDLLVVELPDESDEGDGRRESGTNRDGSGGRRGSNDDGSGSGGFR